MEYERFKIIHDRTYFSDFDRLNRGDNLLPFNLNSDKFTFRCRKLVMLDYQIATNETNKMRAKIFDALFN